MGKGLRGVRPCPWGGARSVIHRLFWTVCPEETVPQTYVRGTGVFHRVYDQYETEAACSFVIYSNEL